MKSTKLGVGITTHNSRSVLAACLQELAGLDAYFVLYDSDSSDGTVDLARKMRPDIDVLAGDENAWWAAATNAVVKKCLDEGCDYILLLNPDVRLSTETVRRQLDIASAYGDKIVIPLLVVDGSPEKVAYAGSVLRPVARWWPVIVGRYVVRPGSPITAVPSVPYKTNDMSARGAMIPRVVFESVGLLDDSHFPHYGADVDFSYRARRLGYETILVPDLRGRVVVTQTGIPDFRHYPFGQRFIALQKMLFERKHGEMLRVQWHLQMRHQPFPFGMLMFAANVSWQVWRRLFPR